MSDEGVEAGRFARPLVDVESARCKVVDLSANIGNTGWRDNHRDQAEVDELMLRPLRMQTRSFFRIGWSAEALLVANGSVDHHLDGQLR